MSENIVAKSEQEIKSKCKNFTRNVYIPQSFDPESTPEKWREKLCWLLSIINQRIIYEKLKPNDFVPLMKIILEKVMGRDYKKIINFAVKNKIIEVCHRYSKGHYSKSYKLAPDLQGDKYKRFPIKKYCFLKTLERLYTQQTAKLTHPVHKYLFKWLQELEVTNEEHFSLLEIKEKQFRMSLDDFGMRTHSNLTHLKKEDRHYLKYKEPLITIDIVNSQPLLLGLVLDNYFKSSTPISTLLYQLQLDNELFNSYNKGLVNYNDNNTNIITNSEKTSPPPSSIMCCNFAAVQKREKELKEYMALCSSGMIYEEFMSLTGITDRKVIKEEMFTLLFGTKYNQKFSKLYQAFKNKYPELLNGITKIKEKDHKQLAMMLQRTESALCIFKIISRLMKEFPHMFVATIHDCWIIPQQFQNEVTTIIKEEFQMLNINVQLKIDAL